MRRHGGAPVGQRSDIVEVPETDSQFLHLDREGRDVHRGAVHSIPPAAVVSPHDPHPSIRWYEPGSKGGPVVVADPQGAGHDPAREVQRRDVDFPVPIAGVRPGGPEVAPGEREIELGRGHAAQREGRRGDQGRAVPAPLLVHDLAAGRVRSDDVDAPGGVPRGRLPDEGLA